MQHTVIHEIQKWI